MPSKRSKSKERERKRRAREKMTEEKQEKERANAQERMKLLRSNKSREEADQDREAARSRMMILRERKVSEERCTFREQLEDGREDDWYEKIVARSRKLRANRTEDEREQDRAELRERVKILRARKTPEEMAADREKAKLGMRTTRENETEEGKEYGKIVQKHKKREARARLSGKIHLLQNLAAKKGMIKFKEKGRLLDFQRRSTRNTTEMDDCQNFMKRGGKHSEFLSYAKPDVIELLNQKIREEKETERRKKEEKMKKEKEGEWVYCGETVEWNWIGENEPNNVDTFSCSPLTEEENKLRIEADAREFELFVEERKNSMKEKRKQKEMERKQAMATPISPLPERELCPYEKLRANIIQEREDAMRESGFFDDLMDMKKDIGLIKEKDYKETDPN